MYASEVAPTEYHSFFQTYIGKVGERSLVESLESGMEKTISFFFALPEEKQEFRYATGKWTPKEILLHLIDSERMFSYRALSFARIEHANMPGFDENLFATNSNANTRSISDLLEEYELVRKSTLKMFCSFDDATLERTGIANGYQMSARAAGFIICGHEIHHRGVIEERYLQVD